MGNWDFPGGPECKEFICKVEDLVLNPRLGSFPEKEMAIHSSILSWRIPWTEESDGLQSMVSQRVGHNWVINTNTMGNYYTSQN